MGQKTQQSKVRKRKTDLIFILKCLLLGLIAGFVGTFLWRHYQSDRTTQSAFLAEARRDHTKRQAYVDDLLKGVKIPYCAAVQYDHDGSKLIDYVRSQWILEGKSEAEAKRFAKPHEQELKSGHFDIKTPSLITLAGKDRSTPIFVGRKVFEEYQSWIDQDIKHAIIVHEARHVYQHAKGIDGISMEKLRQWIDQTNHEVAYDYFELDAQIVGFKSIFSGEYQVSAPYLKETKKSYVLAYGNLTQSMESGSPFHREIIGAILGRADEDPRLKEILYYFMEHPTEMFGREEWK